MKKYTSDLCKCQELISKKTIFIFIIILSASISSILAQDNLYMDAENASIENSKNGHITDNGRVLLGANRGQNADRPFFSTNSRAGSKSIGYQINRKGNNASQRIETAIVHYSKPEALKNGTEKYTGFSFQLDKNVWSNPKRWFVIHQIQQTESRTQTGNFPFIALHIDENTNNRLSLVSRSGKNGDVNTINSTESKIKTIDLKKGVWYDVVIGWKFRPKNADGWMSVWIKKSTDANYKQYRKNNIKVGYWDPSKEILQNKFGIYRGAQDIQNRIYFDEVRYAPYFSKARIPNSEATETLIKNGEYNIVSTTSNQNLIAPEWDNHNAQMRNPGNYSDQIWQFKHLGDNKYTIQNKSTNQYLEVPFGKCGKRENVATWIGAGDNHQKWKIVKSDNGNYGLKPLHCLNFALDRQFGVKNANVHLWNYSSNNRNQKWKIRSITSKKVLNDLAKRNSAIHLFPNPAGNVVFIEGLNIGDQILIYNLLGERLVQFNAKENRELIPIDTFVSGIYIVSISGKSKFQFIKK